MTYRSHSSGNYNSCSYDYKDCDIAAIGECFVLEAEDFDSINFRDKCSSSASGGEIVKLCSSYGELSTTFSGETAIYDMSIFAQDENDGDSVIKVYVDNVLIATVDLNKGTDGGGSNSGPFSEISLGTIEVPEGANIRIEAQRDGCEYVRIDNLCLVKVDDVADPNGDCPDDVHIVETFDGVCDPDDADTVKSDGKWDIKNGAAYADGRNDGSLKFKAIDVNGETTISFDIKTKDINPFESNDEFIVKVAIDGVWKVLDVFTRDGDEFVGSKTGQTYGESYSNLSYTVGDADTQSIQFKVVADFSWGDETVLVDNVSFFSAGECETCEDTKETFDAGNSGDVVSTQFDGFTVTAQRSGDSANSENDAMLFDTNNTTGGDRDLGYTGKGQVIIISEDNDSSDADDNARGGTITIDFDNPSDVTSLELLDIEENGGTISVFDINGDLIKTVSIPGSTNNSAQTINIDAEGVASMEVNLVGSGAINDLCFEPGVIVDTGDAELRGRYFCDDNDNDVDDGEPGIEGVTVTLTTAGGAFVADTLTLADGSYEFLGLDAGDYVVTFDADPDGKTFVADNVGNDDTIDSDGVDNGNGTASTGVISLAIGEVSEDNDVGVEDPGTAELGNFVFLDNNQDGVFDAADGDYALEGVEVKLLDDDGNAVAGQANQITDANGNYLFTGLNAGSYQVMFTALAGLGFTTEGAAADDVVNNDSDADFLSGMTDIIELSIGESELDIDAGLVVLNEDPEALNDAAMTCADETVTVDVLDNDSDPEGDALTITSVDGQAILEGQSITTSAGTVVTLSGGELIVDGEAAYASLNIGEQANETISYTVSDGNGGSASADLDMTFCGDANDYASLAASFPASAVFTVTGALANGAAFDVTISGTGDARFDGVEFATNAYCLGFFDPIPLNTPVPGDVYDVEAAIATSVFDADQISSVNGLTAADNLDLIQYIVAQDWENDTGVNYDGWDVQFAIWELTDNIDTGDWTGTFTQATESNVDAIIADALANGEGYSFQGDGDVAGMIWDPNPQTSAIQQPFIVGFDFDDYDCLC